MKLEETGLTFEDIKEKVNKYMIETYERMDFLAESAKDQYIYNEKGEKYFESRPEAEETLIWWNKNHGNLNVNKLTYTFKQLFDEWSEIFIPTKEERKRMRKTHETIKGKLGLSNSMGLLAAAKKFKSLYNRKYSSIKKNDFQQSKSK